MNDREDDVRVNPYAKLRWGAVVTYYCSTCPAKTEVVHEVGETWPTGSYGIKPPDGWVEWKQKFSCQYCADRVATTLAEKGPD